jgi:membrane protease YdiL (CAAX protease family)
MEPSTRIASDRIEELRVLRLLLTLVLVAALATLIHVLIMLSMSKDSCRVCVSAPLGSLASLGIVTWYARLKCPALLRASFLWNPSRRRVVLFAIAGGGLLGVLLAKATRALVVGPAAGALGAGEAAPAAVTALGLVVLDPFWEELFFRCLLFSSVSRSTGPVVSAIIQSAIWASLHLDVTSEDPSLGFLLRLFAGLVLAGLFSRTRSLYPPIACHSAYNYFSLGW